MSKDKFYRVKKDTFMWAEGAILKLDPGIGYRSIDDIWDICPLHDEFVSSSIIESTENADWFERVYEVGTLGQVKYVTAEKAREVYNKLYKDK